MCQVASTFSFLLMASLCSLAQARNLIDLGTESFVMESDSTRISLSKQRHPFIFSFKLYISRGQCFCRGRCRRPHMEFQIYQWICQTCKIWRSFGGCHTRRMPNQFRCWLKNHSVLQLSAQLFVILTQYILVRVSKIVLCQIANECIWTAVTPFENNVFVLHLCPAIDTETNFLF